MRSRPLLFRRVARFFVVGSVLGALALVACSDQGEGERCDTNDDCNASADLVCYDRAQLKDSISNRCCPRDRSKSTDPVCKVGVSFVGDATAPADTGPPSSDVDDAGDTGDADSSTEETDASDADTSG